jgi:hypothetical protein
VISGYGDGGCLSKAGDAENYIAKNEETAKVLAWGVFALLLTVPFVIVAVVYVHVAVFVAWTVLLFVIMGVSYYEQYRLKKRLFGFWVESNGIINLPKPLHLQAEHEERHRQERQVFSGEVERR